MKLTSIILENSGAKRRTEAREESRNSITGKTNNIEAFFKLIDRLPDTIESISVPADPFFYMPGSKTTKIKPSNGWKQQIKDILSDVIDQRKTLDLDKINTFELDTYGLDAKPTDKFYIQLRSDNSEEFDKDMSAGKYGPLD